MKKILLTTGLLATSAISSAAFAGGGHSPATATINGEDNNPKNDYYTSPNHNPDEVHDFYIGLSGGWTRIDEQDSNFGGALVNTDLDDGWNTSLHLGYDFALAQGVGLRPEIELGYKTNDIDSHSIGGVNTAGADGRSEAYVAMANFYYDFENSSRFTPYVGAGIGAARVNLDGYSSTTTGPMIDDSDTVFAYQGIAGVDFALDEQWSIFSDYKYFTANDPEVTTSAGNTTDVDFDTHNVQVGLKMKF